MSRPSPTALAASGIALLGGALAVNSLDKTMQFSNDFKLLKTLVRVRLRSAGGPFHEFLSNSKPFI